MELYIVRPEDELSPGEMIELSLRESSRGSAIEEWFPEGLTTQGRRWALADLQTDQNLVAISEWLTELARRSEFGQLPSRFQSVTGYETRESAVRAAERSGSSTKDIFQVTAGDPAGPFYEAHRRGQTVPAILDGARSYWTGTPHSDGEREYLLPCPVNVGQRIHQVEPAIQ